MQMLGFQEKVAYKQPNVPTYCFSSSNLISIITPFCSKNINDYPTLRSKEDIDHVTIRTVMVVQGCFYSVPEEKTVLKLY